MESMMQFLGDVSGFLWGPWTPWVLLAAGVIFTIWTKFTQYNAMTHGIQVVRGVYDDPNDPGAINHFQALSAALSATVGLGNIGGVALAISAGGPGALFWMWIVGIFGMALKTVEITLAMMYRNTDDPENPSGGAMWVVDKVLGEKGGIWKPIGRMIGIFFCITLAISSFTGGDMFQAWSVANLTEGYFGVPKIASGIIIALLVGAVIVGGIKRIGNVAGKLVPFMCLLYLAAALSVLAFHVTEIPAMLKLIVTSAFEPTQAGGAFVGGALGFTFLQGMKRALFSNEAGQGSAPIAHAAAKTDQPAREGIVGGIGPFIDTICICTITALVIISTGTWNRDAVGPLGGETPRLVQDTSASEPTWNLVASDQVSDLPEQRRGVGDWNPGATAYLIAEVEGAVDRLTGASRVKVMGDVVEDRTGVNPDAPGAVKIDWQPLVFDAYTWEGQPTSVRLLENGVYRDYPGANLTGHAFDRQFPGLGKWLVTLAAWLFAISTMISWSYYGEQGVIYVTGGKGVLLYKILFLLAAVWAAAFVEGSRDIQVLMDLGTGAMLWANIPIILSLGYLAVKELNVYMRKQRAGEFPRHK